MSRKGFTKFNSMFNYFKSEHKKQNGHQNEEWLVSNVKKSLGPKVQHRRMQMWDEISSPYDALPVPISRSRFSSVGSDSKDEHEDLHQLMEKESESGALDNFSEALLSGDNVAVAEFIRKLHRKIFSNQPLDDSMVSDEEVLSLLEESLRHLDISLVDVKRILPDVVFRLFMVCSSKVLSDVDDSSTTYEEDSLAEQKADKSVSDASGSEKSQKSLFGDGPDHVGYTRKESLGPTGGIHDGDGPKKLSLRKNTKPRSARAKGPIRRQDAVPNPLSRGASPNLRHKAQYTFELEAKKLNERVANTQPEKVVDADGLNELHRMVFFNDLNGLERYFQHHDTPVKGLEGRDGRGNTPLLLAIRLGNVEVAEFLVRQGARVDMKSSDPHFHLLDETILTRNRRLIRLIYRQLQVITWRKWMGRVPKLIDVLENVQDFYVEMKWSFESNALLTPLVRAVAPSDTYKIWKKGSWLRVDSTISGFARGFKIIRGNMSLVFQGRGGSYPGDLLRINHEKSKVARVFRRVENPTHNEVERAVSRLIHSASKQLTATQLSTSEFEFAKASGRRSRDVISGFDTELYEGIGDVRIINHKKGENDFRYATADEYFDPSVNLDGIALERMDSNSEEDGGVFGWGKKKNAKQRNVATSKQRLHMKMKTQLWMAQDYPLNIREILPILEILSTKDKLIEKLNNILNDNQIPPDHFPVKTKLPLVLGIHALVVFQNFSATSVKDDIFAIPDGYFIRDPLAPLVDSDDEASMSETSHAGTDTTQSEIDISQGENKGPISK